jgi:Protein of unknown function (DUF2442)
MGATMAPDVVDVTYVDGFRLRLTFEDGTSSVVDFALHIQGRGGQSAALNDLAYFQQVRVDRDLHTIVWPNGYDIDPEVLYSWASGKAIDWGTTPVTSSRG